MTKVNTGGHWIWDRSYFDDLESGRAVRPRREVVRREDKVFLVIDRRETGGRYDEYPVAQDAAGYSWKHGIPLPFEFAARASELFFQAQVWTEQRGMD